MKGEKQEQIQIEKEEEEQNKKEDDLDMRDFLKDLKGLHKRVDNCTVEVQKQDQKIININEKLDEYNDEVDHGEDLTNIVGKGVFGSIVDGIKGLFKSKNKYKINESEDKKIIENAKNKKNEINNINEEDNKDNIKDYKFKSDGDWEIIRKKNKDDKDEYDEDEVIDESIKEVKGMINSMKNFNQNVKDSNKLIGVTNKHFDKSHKHVNKAIKKMEDIC